MKTKVDIFKNAVHLTAIALCMTIFASFKNSPASSDTSNIIMTVNPNNNKVVFAMAGSGKITIDWGDGKVRTRKLRIYNDDGLWFFKDKYQYRFAHSYSGSSTHTIKIIGNNITHLSTCKLTNNLRKTNNLTNLDVSGATELKWLDCRNNQLTELDVSANIFLEGLNCFINRLTSLKLSISLTYLECSYNKLTSLDLNNITELIYLWCNENKLTSLELSNNIALVSLWCSINQLTKLELSNNTELKLIVCRRNNLSTDALNALFGTLHNNMSSDKNIHISYNPGANDCDKSIAKEKGWTVTSGFIIIN